MEKLRNIIRKGLEKVVAPVLIGAATLVGSPQEANAHTNDPSFYIMYAEADQVNWTNPATANWQSSYAADLLNANSLNVLVGVFINTGTNSPINISSKMMASSYSYDLTDITLNNKFSITRGIVATNGIWQAKPFQVKTVDVTMYDPGDGTGLLDGNNLQVASANAVFGNGLSSAIQISLNALQMQRGDTLTFQMTGPTSVTYADTSVHTYDADPQISTVNFVHSGSIVMTPEPSSAALFASGCAALGAYTSRKRRKEEDAGKEYK